MNTAPETPLLPPLFAEAEAVSVSEHVIEPGKAYTIDPSDPIAHDDKYNCNITAVITNDREGMLATPDAQEKTDSFVLVDLRQSQTVHGRYKIFGNMTVTADAQFLLIGRNFDGERQGFKGLRLGETIEVGRHDPTTNGRFNLGDFTSRKHFGLTLDLEGKLSITDHHSANGTSVRAHHVHEVVREQTKEEQYEAFRPPEPEPEPQPAQPAPETNALHIPVGYAYKYEQIQRNYGGEIARGELNNAMIAGLLNEVATMRAEGLTSREMTKQLTRRLHPDLVKDHASAEYARQSAMFKIAMSLINDK
ncbi:MAG TPA: FHA domain-containing protein [Candidatus Saccharimonadales bacterium]|nr:FHA domain-containing protein [Candidatus Saccharimonadales bacterium]